MAGDHRSDRPIIDDLAATLGLDAGRRLGSFGH